MKSGEKSEAPKGLDGKKMEDLSWYLSNAMALLLPNLTLQASQLARECGREEVEKALQSDFSEPSEGNDEEWYRLGWIAGCAEMVRSISEVLSDGLDPSERESLSKLVSEASSGMEEFVSKSRKKNQA